MFNRAYYETLAREFAHIHRHFNIDGFKKEVTHNLDELSLNQRMRNTALVLKKYLPDNFVNAIDIMKEVIPNMNTGYTSLVFPEFVSMFGLQHFSASMEALKFFTRFGSSEFAVRVFLKQDIDKTLAVMYTWSLDENHHVRRLASEGSRPRLPWSFKLDAVIQNPSLSAPILDNLKSDSELYVRKSVANHLNDISKDSPGYVRKLVASWDKNNLHTAWIVKRGCRSLLKSGDKKSLTLFNLTRNAKVSIRNFKLNKTTIKLNEVLKFDFNLISNASTPQRLMVHYRIHYVKGSGILSPKIFALKEMQLNPRERVKIAKQQRFQDLSTRTLHSGKHILEILVNGEVHYKKTFGFTRK